MNNCVPTCAIGSWQWPLLIVPARSRCRGGIRRLRTSITACGNPKNNAAAAAADGSLPCQPNQWPFQRLRRQLLRSFDDYGLGPRGLVEGTIGIVLVAGSLATTLRFMWQKASQIVSAPPSYEVIVEFPVAAGITAGTPVRVRGVEVGSVVHVRPCLERIDTHVQVMDPTFYIPRNADVEVHQYGLAGETVIDIMPVDPVPSPNVGPLHPDCRSEGLLVCDKESIQGKQGVSIDELIGICGKMVRKSEISDFRESFKTMEQIAATLDDFKPLFQRIEAFVNDSEAVIEELQGNKAVRDLPELLQILTNTANTTKMSNLSTEDTLDFSKDVARLLRSLKSLEDKSMDTSSILRDEKNRVKIKRLIELLSRLIKA